jgi:hypothetical protein
VARSQSDGYAAGAAAEAFSEGALASPMPGPKSLHDRPHYGGDNDMDDAYHQADVWDNASFPAAPGGVNRDTVG